MSCLTILNLISNYLPSEYPERKKHLHTPVESSPNDKDHFLIHEVIELANQSEESKSHKISPTKANTESQNYERDP